MSTHFPSRLAFLPLAMMVLWVMCMGVMGAEPSPEAARLDVFSHPDGATYFALSLKPAVEAGEPNGSDVVVLFDTSSSQVGKFRDNALAALESLLAGLGPNDRVKLFAVDLNAIAMNPAMAAPGSRELADAVEKLKARVPLGATNMETAMMVAATSFSGETKPRACVYIGDGMSAANVLGTKNFETLVAALTDARVAVSSYAVGPRLDEQLLGALAGRTGGIMKSQENAVVLEKDGKPKDVAALSPQEVGKALAQAATGVVYWPVSAELPKDRMTEVLPKRMPPLRADRDSVLIGTLKGEGPLSIKITANTPSGTKKLAWEVTPGKSEKKNEFLGKLVGVARADGGMSLPLIDSNSLQQARNVSNVSAINLTQLAREAIAVGNLPRAEQMLAEVLRRKPDDRQAKALLAEIKQDKPGAPVEEELNLVGGPQTETDDGAFARTFELDRKIIAEQVTKDVQVAIADARKKAAVGGEEVINNLKLQLENVRRMGQLDPDVRAQLVSQLESALRLTQTRQESAQQDRLRDQESIAAAEARQLIVKDLAHKRDQIKQLLGQFDSLMREDGYREMNYRLAEEEVALKALEIAQSEQMASIEPQIGQAIAYARVKRYYQEGQRHRVRRQKAVLAAFNSAETSSFAIDDSEPVVYPDPEIWNQMSERRKKDSVVELSSSNEAEKRIREELKKKTKFQFQDNTLGEVVEYLKDLHQIEIRLDKEPLLEELDLSSDTPVTCMLENISLRNALELMLRDLDLTYIIKNEVLLITTKTVADENLAARVYPVGDLVIPIRNSPMGGMGMGGMGMGGMGGMGGGMGGMGGGMGGMGGGMG
ncbi:MAG: hypothetical protein JW888_17040, partial [Pirellulales bacterium]|nr:hypothetical protein [Pirellulales bacterium]